MQSLLQRQARVMRLLSLACQSANTATISCSLLEANQILDNLETASPGETHFVETAFGINIDLLKGLDNMVTTDFDGIAARIQKLTGEVREQQRTLAEN